MLLFVFMSKVEKAILKTLAFFEIFSRPLTLEELWDFLYQTQASRLQILIGLKKLKEKRKITQQDNHYFLAGSKIYKDFLKNREICKKRWQKVIWIVKILKFIPFVKNISVINSLSFGSSNEDSDIDILIVTKKNRLWTTRALIIAVLEILGQNKNKWYQANKFCLGFAFDEERLALSKFRLKNDIYLSYWLASLKPVLDKKVYNIFIEKNSWIYKELPNWKPKDPILKESKPNSFWEKILSGSLGEKIEKKLAQLQIKHIWSDPKSWHKGGSVIADNHMLKLHPYDRRSFFQEKWQKRIAKINI